MITALWGLLFIINVSALAFLLWCLVWNVFYNIAYEIKYSEFFPWPGLLVGFVVSTLSIALTLSAILILDNII